MSLSALKKAVYARLAGVETLTNEALSAQTALAALLETDPDTELPAVHQGNRGKLTPCICFRESGGAPDTRWTEENGGIDDVILDVDIWSGSEAAQVISDIHDYVDRLLNDRRGIAPLLDLESGRIKYSESVTRLQLLPYDEQANLRMGFARYMFRLAYY